MYSGYFEKDIELNNDDIETLLDIYEDIAREKGFEPDYEDRELVDFEEDTPLFDTVLYHVDTFGKEHSDYSYISHLFETNTPSFEAGSVDAAKWLYNNEDVVMSELLRSEEFSGLSRDEKIELLAWSGDDEFVAVNSAGEIVDFDELTQEEKVEILFPKAVAYYSADAGVDVYNDFVQKHANEYIYCYEHQKDLIDLDFWCDYQELLGEKISWAEYLAIDEHLDGAPADYTAEDVEVVNMLREKLTAFREASKAEKAQALVDELKSHYENGDIPSAYTCWCDIYDLFEPREDMSSEERFVLFAEQQKYISQISDEEVYAITDYGKETSYKEQGYYAGDVDELLSDASSRVVDGTPGVTGKDNFVKE